MHTDNVETKYLACPKLSKLFKSSLHPVQPCGLVQLSVIYKVITFTLHWVQLPGLSVLLNF